VWSPLTVQLIRAACDEDLGALGDVSSALLPDADADVAARVLSRAAGVICGLALGPAICDVFSQRLGNPLRFEPAPGQPHERQNPARQGGANAVSPGASTGSAAPADGDRIQRGQVVAYVHGPKAAVLAVERTLLNFLCRMSGVATLTRRFVDAARAANPHVQLLDTRKTLPGWRELDRYAVRCGGGQNHRMGLYDAVLIKDNHLAGVPLERLAETLAAMLERLRCATAVSAVAGHEGTAHRAVAHGSEPGAEAAGQSEREAQASAARKDATATRFVEVEVGRIEQLAEVCKLPGVDIVLLDNFTPEQMRAAVKLRDDRGLRGMLLEASGGVTLANVAEIAATGVDRISIGALTHSAPALDLALEL